MVCPRCVRAVEEVFNRNGIAYLEVLLGRVRTKDPLSSEKVTIIENELRHLGFELLKSRDAQRIESVKNALIKLVHEGDIPPSFSLSGYLGGCLAENYTVLSHLFSGLEGITIEKYFIQLKVEKVKEWLSYDETTLSEASYRLGYSSVQHLSAQFTKVTGLTPSKYKKLSFKPRVGLDNLSSPTFVQGLK